MRIHNIADNEKDKNNDPIEKCVICGGETPYRLSTPISQREFYEVGLGQICRHCHIKIYIKRNWW